MNVEYPSSQSGDFGEQLQARAERGGVLASMHAKLVEARSNDSKLKGPDDTVSYLFVQNMPMPELHGLNYQYARTMLVPRRGVNVHESNVSRLQLDILTLPVEQATNHDRQLFDANLLAQQVAASGLYRLFAGGPVQASLQAAVGQAVSADGAKIRFALNLDGYWAIDESAEIYQELAANYNGDLRLSSESVATSSLLQSELESEFFSLFDLDRYLSESEPIQFGGYASSSSVA